MDWFLYDSGLRLKELNKKIYINPFSTNVPLKDKPGSWFY